MVQFLLMGTVAGSGVLTSRAQYRPTEEVTLKYESRIQGGGYPPMFMGDVEYCGQDWNGQLKTGYGGFYGANYMQNISHHVSLGGEVFYLSQQKRSGVGLAARLAEEKSVSTLQVWPRFAVCCSCYTVLTRVIDVIVCCAMCEASPQVYVLQDDTHIGLFSMENIPLISLTLVY